MKINHSKLNSLLLIILIIGFFQCNVNASPNPTKGVSRKKHTSEVNQNTELNPFKWFSEKKPTLVKPVLLSKYTVNFSITTECKITEYYKNAQTIFFPLLMLNSDGSLLNNYEQSYSTNNDYLIFSSKDNINTSIQSAANKFSTKFDFNESPYLFTLPIDLKESYFIRFYYHVNSEPIAYNSVYLKSSIEYINPEAGHQVPVNVWTGEAHFAFDKSIVKATFLDVAIQKVFEYAFRNHSDNGRFHILDM